MSELVLKESKLPEKWITEKLGNISELFVPMRDKPKKFDGNTPWLRIEDLDGKYAIDSKSNQRVSEKTILDMKLRVYPIGTVLCSCSATIGLCAITKNKLITNQTFIGINPVDILYNEFLYYFLLSQTNYLKKIGTGITIKYISRKKFENFPIPLPPLNEQKKIVKKIETLFSNLDNTKILIENIYFQLKQYQNVLLKSALSGDLSKHWREENLKFTVNKDVNEAKIPDPSFEWKWFSFGEIIEPSKEKFEPKENKNRIFIGLEHIEKHTGKIVGNGNSTNMRSTKTIFNKNNVLYGRLRPYLNKVCVPDFDGVCSTDILVFQENNYILSKFLSYLLQENNFVRFANKNMSGVNHPRISFDKISKFKINLPSIEEQKEIVTVIEQGYLLIEHIASIVVSLKKQLDILKSSTLKQAFEGKLVPQDPNDEPAEILLQKIKQEKEQLKQKEKSNKRKKNGR